MNQNTTSQRFWAWSGFLLASMFYLYEFCLQVSPTVMTDLLMTNYKTTAAGVGVISGFYFYAYTMMQIPVGLLYDRFSTKNLLGFANFVCALGAILFVSSNSFFVACAARFLMGLGSAFAFVAVIIFANRWFKPVYFATLIGFAQLMSSFGAISAETPLSYIVDKIGWESTMIGIGIFGVALGLLTILFAKDGQAAEQTQKRTWSDQIKKLKHLLKDDQVLAVGFYTFFIWSPITAFAGLWGVPFIRTVYQVSELTAASYCIVIWIAIGIASPVAGIISDYYQNRREVLSILAVLGVIGSVMAVAAWATSVWYLVISMSLIGIAAGGQSLSFAVVNDNQIPANVGAASGINNMFTVAGGAIFQPLIGYILHWVSQGEIVNATPIYTKHDYQLSMLVVPLCFLAAWIASHIFLAESYHNETV